ncbi:MAG: hypothetical protein WA624_21785 [Methylocella sp.]
MSTMAIKASGSVPDLQIAAAAPKRAEDWRQGDRRIADERIKQ